MAHCSGLYLKSLECRRRGSHIFPTFTKFLKAGGSESEELKEKLNQEFGKLGSHLKSGGPFLMGKAISAADLALGPRLYHVTVASREFKVIAGLECASSLGRDWQPSMHAWPEVEDRTSSQQ